MKTGRGNYTYEWIDNWARIPDTASGKANGRTHGVAVSKSGDVVVFNQADPGVLIFDGDGKLKNSWGKQFAAAHGLSLVEEDGQEYLWLTDENSAQVVKTTLDGQTMQELTPPPIDAYKEGKYVPTWVAVNEKWFGGNGDIWVADGYGQSYVHLYDEVGNYQRSINGEEGKAGRFACPHGIMFSYRRNEPELYIADRGNKRIQVYDGQGKYKRAIEGTVHSPCGFVFLDDLLMTPELYGGVKILDGDDRLVVSLGENVDVLRIPGWPNLQGTEHVAPGLFNSPHGMAVAPNGDIFVAEWIIGGRITKLVKQ
jgi:DNA-binding beta-propeller fold protein YncE